MMPDLPFWAWMVLAHVTGLGGGFAIAIGVGIARAVKEDTDWHLAEMQQAQLNKEPKA